MGEHKPSDIEAFIGLLPDPEAARTFLLRLETVAPLTRPDDLLLSRLLTIAAYSPFLAETVLRHPEYISWLKRETEAEFGRVKSAEQLSEELARFITRSIDADERTRLARFKRRELLRIYLRDCLNVATLSEVTEELSNLADVILAHALALALQEMTNRHGSPLTIDDRGRRAQAEMAIVALGKLGCRELNYASDIDLLFLYSGQGNTAGDGRRPDSAISNKEFFTSVANRVVQIIGSSAGEGAVYRIDLRLRPYGRDGDTVWETNLAADYYRTKAHNWERQALIRARAAAGASTVVARFLDLVRDVVFHKEALGTAMADVRKAKEKIDREAARASGGFNVKLGRGGIREIEFIAQALQLAHGGREPWVRSAQTLIVLARLAEKGYLSEQERTRLSSAYTFLRTVEHRLQMELGVQTHRLPIAAERLELLARRSGYNRHAEPAAAFLADLEAHAAAVRAVYNRVFAGDQPEARASVARAATRDAENREQHPDDETERLINHASAAVNKLLAAHGEQDSDLRVKAAIAAALPVAIEPLRSLRNLMAWADSLATYETASSPETRAILSGAWLPETIERLIAVLSSPYLAHILLSRPALARTLIESSEASDPNFFQVMSEAVTHASDTASKTDALRRAWYRAVVEIGYRDMSGAADLRFQISNLKSKIDPRPRTAALQTALAETSLRFGVMIALESLGVSEDRIARLPFSVMGLGRLGHAGMDYGSDLDLLIVFDDSSTSTESGFASPSEFYARLTAQLVKVLSSITREGFLYRIDLRLRPDGQSGPLAQGLSGLLSYLKERASAWEHSAYLKAREVAGDLKFGARARQAICETIFDSAGANASLGQELSAMRARLEKEKARQARANIKWGRGGMTDVYFITRYLQLRDRIDFPPELGTSALIKHLGVRGALTVVQAETLFEGYSFLRRLDHWMRLLLDRPVPVLPASHIALGAIARALALDRAEAVERELEHHTARIREVYDQVFR
jgi:glutamate-ammonia-ligase adenylyltransferase